jgi:hypothetical protein
MAKIMGSWERPNVDSRIANKPSKYMFYIIINILCCWKDTNKTCFYAPIFGQRKPRNYNVNGLTKSVLNFPV